MDKAAAAKILISALVGASLLLVAWAVFFKTGKTGSSLHSPSSALHQGTGDFLTSWQDETQYIVESVILDIAGMNSFAKAKNGTKPDELSVKTQLAEVDGGLIYEVTVSRSEGAPIKGTVSLSGSVWSPQTYLEIARDIWAGSPPPATKTEPLPDLKELLEPTPENLIKVDEELSPLLRKYPSDPELHAAAAVLLGSFALREASGKFFTTRAEMNRMTAHLSSALALDPRLLSYDKASSHEGAQLAKLSMVILLTLQNNQLAALKLLDTLPSTAAFSPWRTALRTRITGDHRKAHSDTDMTLLESREFFRAGCERLDAETVLADPQWAHIIAAGEMAGPGSSVLSDWLRLPAMRKVPVPVGHVLHADSSLLLSELAEARHVYEHYHPKNTESEGWVSSLNEAPSPFGTGVDPSSPSSLRILDWSFWSAQAQRHICSAVVNQSYFLQEQLGADQAAAGFRAEAGKLFSELRLYPFVRVVSTVDQGDYVSAQEEARKVMLSHPQEVGPELWNHTCYHNPNTKLYIPPPHAYVNEWHRHNPPPGTAYDPLPRMNQPSLTEGEGAIERLRALNQMAPFDMDISYNFLRIKKDNLGHEVTYNDRLEVYSPIAEYDFKAMSEMATASADNPTKFEEWMKKAISVNPDSRTKLANHYRKHGRDSEAVSLYLEWLEETLDLVSGDVANYVINYLEDNGLVRDADRVADKVAKSYSAAGLLAKASLLERRGDWEGAYLEQDKVVQRYGRTDALVAFLLRGLGATGAPPAPPSTQSRMNHQFEQLGHGDIASVLTPHTSTTTPPKKGVLVQIDSATVTRVGLQQGDIIVAVRGYRVNDWASFKILRALKNGTPYEVTVWRNGSYIDVPAINDGHRFTVDLESWESPDL